MLFWPNDCRKQPGENPKTKRLQHPPIVLSHVPDRRPHQEPLLRSNLIISSIWVIAFASRKNGMPLKPPTRKRSTSGPATLMPCWIWASFTSTETNSTKRSKLISSCDQSTHPTLPTCLQK